MAAPTYATDLNDIFLDGGGTAWTLVGGGRQTDPETDDYIQGSSCWSHDPFNSGIEGGVYPSTETVASGDAIFYWIKGDIAAALATHAAGGMQVLVGNAATALKCYYVRGSDDYAYGGWICVPVDPTITPSTTIGSPTSVAAFFGAQWNIPSTGPSKGYPFKVDAMRHGRQIEITAGDSGTPATWDSVAAHDATSTRQWGICQPTNTGAALQGLIYWGTGAAAVYSRDSNRTIAIIDTEWTATDFTQLLFAHASNDVVWDNVGLIALGTSNRGIIDVTANGAITWTNSVFQGIDTTTLLAGSTFDGSKWLGTNEVDGGGASLLGCKILTPTVATSSHGLLWNVATDPNGLLDGMEFSKGTNAHHAIEFGTTSPLTMTLTDCVFTGFGADTTTSAALHIMRTGGTVTINYTGTVPTYTSEGATVVLVSSKEATFTPIENGSAFTITKNSDNSVLLDVASVTGAAVVYSYDGALDGTATTVHLIIVGKEPIDFPWTVAEGTVPISQVTDRVYSNP